jgi:hypothetical protein
MKAVMFSVNLSLRPRLLANAFLAGAIFLLLGCAPTTPRFDENFGSAFKQATDSQKIPSREAENVLPSAVEFEKATSAHLGGGYSSGSLPSSSSPSISSK